MGTYLTKNKDAILEVSRDTKPYGPHPRQTLDIYCPHPLTKEDTLYGPFLIFVHGGGLIRGDKILPFIPGGLVYHNLGAFFAKRGITTIIPNYRLVNSPFGGHDAVYPSGADDLALVLEFIATLDHPRQRDVFVMGNSAGGVHLSTFLLEPKFLEQRKALLSTKGPVIWKGAIALAVPFHFKNAVEARSGMLKTYYGDKKEIEERSAYGLLQTLANAGKMKEEAFIPNILAILGEFDPEDEIKEPTKDFVELGNEIWDKSIELWTIPGHNHISPPVALMTGDEELEKWGEDVVKWVRGLSS